MAHGLAPRFASTGIRSVSALLAVVCLAGCRLYGGYGSVEANNEELQIVVADFAEAAEDAARDVARLTAASGLDPALVDAFRGIAEAHAASADELAAELAASGSLGYRPASRKLGAVLSMHRSYNDQYQSILRAMLGNAEVASGDRVSRYQAIPPPYFRQAATLVSVDDVTRSVNR